MRVVVALVALAACGGDDGGSGTVDASVTVDGSTAKVVAVTCPASPAATVMSSTANDTSYMPAATTISTGSIVRFVMANTHDVAPNTLTTTDPALVVGFGATKCFQFNTAGTYGFFCSAHSFAGTITVQ